MSKGTPTTRRVTIARTRRIDISDRTAAEQSLTDLPADLVAVVEVGAITFRGACSLAAARRDGGEVCGGCGTATGAQR